MPFEFPYGARRCRSPLRFVPLIVCLVFALAALGLSVAPDTALAKSYKIVYKLNGGTQAVGQTLRVPKGKTVSTAELKKPKRAGYTFKGWYTTKKLAKKVRFVKGAAAKSNRTLYAKWVPRKYTIAYKLANGKLRGSYPKTYTYAKGTKLPTPTRKGYEFVGWYKDKAKTKLAKKISATARGNKTFYAKWKAKIYSIKYKLHGGQLQGSYPATYKTTKKVNLPTAYRQGYVFLGWYADSSYTTAVDSIEKGSVGNKTLHARWAKRFLVAHRGYHVDYPDNSIDAYRAAKDAGFQYAECDVRFTSDDVAVLSHDASIPVYVEVEDEPGDNGEGEDGGKGAEGEEGPESGDDGQAEDEETAKDDELAEGEDGGQPESEEGEDKGSDGDGGSGGGENVVESSLTIADTPYEQIMSATLVNASTGPNGANIATFDEFADACSDIGLVPFVHLKTGTKEQISQLVASARAHGLENAIWYSGGLTRLGYVSAADPASNIVYGNTSLTEAKVKKAAKLGVAGRFAGITCNASYLDDSVVALCKQYHVPLGTWTLKSVAAVDSLDPNVAFALVDNVAASR